MFDLREQRQSGPWQASKWAFITVRHSEKPVIVRRDEVSAVAGPELAHRPLDCNEWGVRSQPVRLGEEPLNCKKLQRGQNAHVEERISQREHKVRTFSDDQTCKCCRLNWCPRQLSGKKPKRMKAHCIRQGLSCLCADEAYFSS